MTTDHEPIDPADQEFDDRLARRLGRVAEGMQVPMTTSAQAAAAGRRRQRGTRVVAAAGAVALIAVAIGIVLAIQPLGVSDVVEAPGASCADVDGVDSTGQPGREVRLEPAGITGWARVDAEAPPLPTGEVIAVEWGLNGTGDVQAHTLSPDGTRAEPDFFAAQEPSSSDQPGDRYQTAHVFEQPGCWQLEMTRNEGSARLALQVVDAAEIEPAGLTTDLLDARIDQARAAADDVDDDNGVHDALDDDIVTLDELEVARQVAEQCARDRDPTATITLGEHIGDIGAEHGGDANAVEDCIDRHLAPTQDALLTLFEPTVQQQTAVPNCGGDAPDRCVDDAEAAVDDIFLANMRRAAELGYGPASIPTPTSPLAQDDVGLDPSVVFDLGDDVLVAAGGGDAPGRAASAVLPRQFDLLVRCDGGGSAQLLFDDSARDAPEPIACDGDVHELSLDLDRGPDRIDITSAPDAGGVGPWAIAVRNR